MLSFFPAFTVRHHLWVQHWFHLVMQEGALGKGRLDTERYYVTITVPAEEPDSPAFHVFIYQVMVVWHALNRQKVALVGIAKQINRIHQFYLSWIHTPLSLIHILHHWVC